MKCFLCNKSYHHKTVSDMLKLHNTCKNCHELYIYDKKNVKIGRSKMIIYQFRYYDLINFYHYRPDRKKYYHYLQQHKKIKFNKVEELGVRHKLIFSYQRHNLTMISKCLKPYLLQRKGKIILYEII